MVERSARHAATPIATSLLSVSSPDVAWQDNLIAVSKEGVVGKIEPNCEDEEGDNNQEEDGSSAVDDNECHGHKKVEISLPKSEALDGSDKLQHLQNDNATLARRLAQMEAEHARSVGKLEAKLKQTIETHRQVEQQLRSQLQTVLHEQQAAAENARKVRTLLTRVSNWMRQVQRAAQRERSLHSAKRVARDLELRVTPRTESPYVLWSSGASLATNVPECDESPTASKFTQNQQCPDSYGILIDSNVNPLPPPAPGRNRAKSLPVNCFNYVGYPVPSPAEGDMLKPVGGTEFVLDGLLSVGTAPRRDTPMRKRSAGSLLAYCAQVVTTSLAGVRSSPSPKAKVTPAWKLDRLSSVHEVDEEAGQCSRSGSRSKPLDVALPNLSIGLL
ncbi:hypothetical protein PC129_g7399 [Phytophthora cactorum]|uniref:Uncharacterized protein n=1 Tax=Phytophthora cactorum TaxID=29920 RepID=A0A329SN42_9STRA|nr:hypothetical protein Pcac1_g2428 [Phytophthora cactorum]KAG2838460.1 hypothetical protein PC112_g4497 [Phytophthora cactorum]KAG2840074.1 hypothetical protein PC111_g3616 [Phytophthora cactorum]KAG2865175.1 hypothetical protein PC113_g3952 [Phytophthora cactorum]KAG2935593.1 hypothetical protein PC114_g495 [Phytophthora cactorum]